MKIQLLSDLHNEFYPGHKAPPISPTDADVVVLAGDIDLGVGGVHWAAEQAERLGIQIKDEFARLALGSNAPARLGERCTVFMERDVTAALGRGARLDDVTGGLAYSVALNYLNRVVRGRKIGDVIYFQGGTAYNDAVAAAFSTLLGKPVIVPPHNGIIGAIGMALIGVDASVERVNAALASITGRSAELLQELMGNVDVARFLPLLFGEVQVAALAEENNPLRYTWQTPSHARRHA